MDTTKNLRHIIAGCIVAAVAIGLVALAWTNGSTAPSTPPTPNKPEAAPTEGSTLERDTVPPLRSIGVTAAEAKCLPDQTNNVKARRQHIPEGTALTFPTAPAATGDHYPTWVTRPQERHFYTRQDRPALGYLVHNQEHGYTILWYDDTIDEDSRQYEQLQQIAANFPVDGAFENKFIVAPWTGEDMEQVDKAARSTFTGFPKGTHFAFTHWSLGPKAEDENGRLGVRRFCGDLSGAAVASFTKQYPYTDAPEALVP